MTDINYIMNILQLIITVKYNNWSYIWTGHKAMPHFGNGYLNTTNQFLKVQIQVKFVIHLKVILNVKVKIRCCSWWSETQVRGTHMQVIMDKCIGCNFLTLDCLRRKSSYFFQLQTNNISKTCNMITENNVPLTSAYTQQINTKFVSSPPLSHTADKIHEIYHFNHSQIEKF